jgi:hypothetical protein
MITKKNFTREDFMLFFRDNDKLNTLTNNDRIEVFSQILAGGSDLTIELLNSILLDYSKDDIEVVNVVHD